MLTMNDQRARNKVATTAVKIHPRKRTRASRLSSFPVRASWRARGSSPLRICMATLYPSVTNHSEREQTQRAAIRQHKREGGPTSQRTTTTRASKKQRAPLS